MLDLKNVSFELYIYIYMYTVYIQRKGLLKIPIDYSSTMR